jgi:hypothetical protein
MAKRLPRSHWEKSGRWEATPKLIHLPDEVFRIGVSFQDGRSATSLESLGSQRPNGPTFTWWPWRLRLVASTLLDRRIPRQRANHPRLGVADSSSVRKPPRPAHRPTPNSSPAGTYHRTLSDWLGRDVRSVCSAVLVASRDPPASAQTSRCCKGASSETVSIRIASWTFGCYATSMLQRSASSASAFPGYLLLRRPPTNGSMPVRAARQRRLCCASLESGIERS